MVIKYLIEESMVYVYFTETRQGGSTEPTFHVQGYRHVEKVFDKAMKNLIQSVLTRKGTTATVPS